MKDSFFKQDWNSLTYGTVLDLEVFVTEAQCSRHWRINPEVPRLCSTLSIAGNQLGFVLPYAALQMTVVYPSRDLVMNIQNVRLPGSWTYDSFMSLEFTKFTCKFCPSHNQLEPDMNSILTPKFEFFLITDLQKWFRFWAWESEIRGEVSGGWNIIGN